MKGDFRQTIIAAFAWVGPRKTTKGCSKSNQYEGQDLNPEPPECEGGVTTQPRHLGTLILKTWERESELDATASGQDLVVNNLINFRGTTESWRIS